MFGPISAKPGKVDGQKRVEDPVAGTEDPNSVGKGLGKHGTERDGDRQRLDVNTTGDAVVVNVNQWE